VGFLHLKPTAGCQISTLIFEKQIVERDIKISHEKYIKDAKFLSTWGLSQRYYSGL
jgi:hypothetical protein